MLVEGIEPWSWLHTNVLAINSVLAINGVLAHHFVKQYDPNALICFLELL
jgi:hypothetical protein